MKIPVFLSCPTELSDVQNASREYILKFFSMLDLEPRALGRSDYPSELPLREVMVIARHCSGGVIMGFEQIRVTTGISKPGTSSEKIIDEKNPVSIPTPWNHLEAGILFGLRLPLLIFREESVRGAVFDEGVTDVFVHKIPASGFGSSKDDEIKQVFLKWHAKVLKHYYK